MSLGPLVRKELVAVSRRSRTFWMRVGTLGILTLLMVPLLIELVIQSHEPWGMQGAASILFQVFVWAQFTLLVMSAPAFSAGAISTERRRGTIDLLKLAAIRPPAFTVGKFLGAAGLPFLLVLSEVPFLFIWTLFGGVAVESILAALVLSASATVLLIAVGLFVSAVTETSGIAMVLSYGVALLYLTVQWWAAPVLPAGGDSWLVQTALWAQLNSTGVTPYPWWRAALAAVVASLLLSGAASLFLVQAAPVSRLLDRTRLGSGAERPSRRVWGRPILWREVYGGGGRRVATFLGSATAASLVCFLVCVLVEDDHLRNVLGAILVALPAVTGGVLGAISIALEKEGRSMGALLLIPSSASSVVLEKFAGSCARALPLCLLPFLLGFVRMEQLWMWLSLSSVLISLLLIALGTLMSVMFARTAVAVASTFGGLVLLSFCCCSNTALLSAFPLAYGSGKGTALTGLAIFAISTVIYAVMVATILAIAVAMFEGRAREAV